MARLATKPVPQAPIERWLPVVGLEGRYDVSDQGRVWSRLKNIVLRPGPTSKGYLSVCLYPNSRPKKAKSFCVHDLVLAAFKGPKPEGYQVDHGELGKQCNWLTNLEYVTPQENIRRSVERGCIVTYRGSENVNSKLTPDDVREIRRICSTPSRGMYARLGRVYSVAQDVISKAHKGKSYTNVI